MNRNFFTLSAMLLTIGVSLGASDAEASHRNDVVRVHLAVHEHSVHQHGPQTLKLRRMIRRQHGFDLEGYRLKAIVVSNGPFSNGYASLRVGERRSGRIFLPGRERIYITAPSRRSDDWRLRLGPGTQVRMVTAVLERRQRGHARGRSHGHRQADYHRHSHANRHHHRNSGETARTADRVYPRLRTLAG